MLPVWIALSGLLAALSFFNWTSSDIWYHLYLGHRIIETHMAQPTDNLVLHQSSFVNIYWLFQLVCLFLYSTIGVIGVSAFFGLAWGAIGFVWVRVTRLKTHPILSGPLLLAALLIGSTRFEQRPEVFSYLFLILQIDWLTRWDLEEGISGRRLALFGVVEVLWANVHGYFPLGIFMVGLKGICEAASSRWRGVKSAAKLLGVALAASFVSPLGAGTWLHVIYQGRFLSEMHYGVQEFIPPVGDFLKLWTVDLFWIYWAVVAFATFRTFLGGKKNLFAALLSVVGLYLSAFSMRNIPLILFFSAPTMALWLNDLPDYPLIKTLKARFLGTEVFWREVSRWMTTGAAAGLALWVVQGGFYQSIYSGLEFGTHLSDAAFPLHFSQYLEQNGFPGLIFNISGDGGYLEYHFPNLRLYGDSRFVDRNGVAEYFVADIDPTAFERLNSKCHFDGVLLNIVDNSPVVLNLFQDPNWRLAYADLHRVFFVNLRSHEWESRFFWPPHYYQGQDLSQRIQGRAAIQWVQIFTQLNQRDALLQVLRAFDQASRVPSFVVEFALRYGFQHHDKQVLQAAASMRPKIVALRADDERIVDDLLAHL